MMMNVMIIITMSYDGDDNADNADDNYSVDDDGDDELL